MREKGKLGFIEKKIGKRFEQKAVPTGREICEKQLFHMIGRIENIEIKDTQIEQYLPAIYAKLSWMSREDLIQRFVSVEFNHFLSYYKNAPDLNVEPLSKKGALPLEKGKPGAARREEKGNFAKVFFNLGKKDQITPKALIDLINKHTKGKSLRIGRIDLQRNFSLVEIEPQFVDLLVKALDGKVIHGFTLQVREDKRK
jgi:ATP-dependent RNA helicase DeaD